MVQPIIMISMPRTADANRDRATLSGLSAPPIGTVIDSSVFMRIDVARDIIVVMVKPPSFCQEKHSARERAMTHARTHSSCMYFIPYTRRRGVRSFQFPASRNRRAQPVQSYRCTTGRIVLSLPLDGEVSRAKRHFSSGRISLEDRRPVVARPVGSVRIAPVKWRN